MRNQKERERAHERESARAHKREHERAYVREHKREHERQDETRQDKTRRSEKRKDSDNSVVAATNYNSAGGVGSATQIKCRRKRTRQGVHQTPAIEKHVYETRTQLALQRDTTLV